MNFSNDLKSIVDDLIHLHQQAIYDSASPKNQRLYGVLTRELKRLTRILKPTEIEMLFKQINLRFLEMNQTRDSIASTRDIHCPEPCAPARSAVKKGQIEVFHPKIREKINPYDSIILDQSISPQGDRIVLGDQSGHLIVWDYNENEIIAERQSVNQSPIQAVRFFQSGQSVVFGTSSGIIQTWNYTDNVENTIQLPFGSNSVGDISSIEISNDGKKIAVVSMSLGTFLIINEVPHKIASNETSFIISATLSPDNNTLITGDIDGRIQMWSAHSGTFIKDLYKISKPINGLEFSKNGNWLAIASDDGLVRIMDTKGEFIVERLKAGHSNTSKPQISDNSEIVATLADHGHLQLWSSKDWTLIGEIELNDPKLHKISLHPSGRALLMNGHGFYWNLVEEVDLTENEVL